MPPLRLPAGASTYRHSTIPPQTMHPIIPPHHPANPHAPIPPTPPLPTPATPLRTPRPPPPALDGRRGSAILLVLAIHSSLVLPPSLLMDICSIGWIGVDLFFVLSGFLITGILFDAKSHP